MRRTLLFTIVLVASLALLTSSQSLTSRLVIQALASINQEQDQKEKKRGLEREEEERQEHEQDFLRKHSDASGKVRPDLWQQGIEHYQRMQIGADVRLANPTAFAAAGGVIGVQWKQIGPSRLKIDKEKNFQGDGPDSGEVLDIAIDPRNGTDQTIYIATNDGGIWKTTDGGASWKPKTDFMKSISMGAVVLDPGNPSIVYAGTGNAFDGGFVFGARKLAGGNFYKGVGVYKSIDGGETWTVVGQAALTSLGIVRMVMPSPGVLLVGTTNGLFRSADGGANFGNNAPSFNNNSPVLNGCVSDLHLDTASSSIVLAAIAGTGIFRSTDGGVTFPASSNLFTPTNGTPTANFDYVSFAQSTQPNNQTIYASVKDSRAQTTPPMPSPFPFLGLFKSIDGGTTWARMTAIDASANGCQCGYDQTIGVDPQDANRVYLGFQQLYFSGDGGGSFSNVSDGKIHWDHHAITFSPASHISSGPPTRVWIGTDGGVHNTADAGSNWSNPNEGIATNLLFSLDIGRGSSTNNAYSYGGTQDTGTIERRPGFSGNEWHLGVDGDGGRIAVDPCDPKHAIGTDNAGFIATTDGGDNWGGSGGLPSGTKVGIVKFDPNCKNAYLGGSTPAAMPMMPNVLRLFQSTDNAAMFSPISTFTAGITAIATTKQDQNTLWVALGNGTLQRTSNVLMGSSATWTPVTVTNAPGGAPSALAIDPTNSNIVVAVYPGFTGRSPANLTRHVFMTVDNGITWTDIGGTPVAGGGDPAQNLPDLPIFDVVIDPGTIPHTIIIAADTGVLRTSNLGATWEIYGLGLPNVYCSALALDSDVTPSVLRVATYGRSVFELSAAEGPLLAINANAAFGDVCVGQSETRNVQLFNVGTTDLHINSFFRLSGSAEFQLVSGPSPPVTIRPGDHLDFTIRFQPGSAGDKTAIFQINSDDLFQPTRQLAVSATGVTQRIATLIADSGNFGGVCLDSFKDLNLTISNSGACDLAVSNITLTPGADFLLPSVLSYPVVIHAGDSIQVPIRFQPLTKGDKNATVRIFSDDPLTPTKTVLISGKALAPAIIVNDPILFDKTCPGNVNNQTLTIGNSGQCDLIVKSITSDSPEFKVFGVVPFPLIVPPGSTRDVTIQFMPMGFTINPVHMATLTIMSNDPDMLIKTVNVKGIVPPPIIQVMPDPLDFGKVCLGKSKDLPLTIKNAGECNLTISNITSNTPEFTLPNLPAFPLVIPPGGMRDVIVRFTPSSTGPKSGKITIISDDPATPIKMVTVMGTAPVSAIAVSGSLDWGDVLVGKSKEQVVNITNTEECDLAITLVCEVKNVVPQQPSIEFKVVNVLNYPVLIPAGGTLPVSIRFKPVKKGPREATLVVYGYDPQTSNLVLTASYPLKGNGK